MYIQSNAKCHLEWNNFAFDKVAVKVFYDRMKLKWMYGQRNLEFGYQLHLGMRIKNTISYYV